MLLCYYYFGLEVPQILQELKKYLENTKIILGRIDSSVSLTCPPLRCVNQYMTNNKNEYDYDDDVKIWQSKSASGRQWR